ncbi:permease [bacterium]|nr:permease [bacterium]
MLIFTYLSELWKILTELAPWLFFGAGLAGLLKIALPKGFIQKHTGGTRWFNIFKTTLMGIPLPLCSCGVLPTTVSLKKDGASNGSAVGFLISTPQTGVDSLVVTASFLGWPLAIFKVAAALITGLLGGTLVHMTDQWKRNKQPTSHKDTHATTVPEDRALKTLWRTFWNYSINELIGSIYKYLAIGILVAALITTLFPTDSLTHIPGLQGIGGMLVMLAFAIPLYICTTGSVPIAASLVTAGLPVGSALVFLMAGPATNAATLAAILSTFGKRITAIYLSTVILGSLVFGLLFQSFFPSAAALNPFMQHEHGSLLRLLIDSGSALVLSGLVVYWSWLDLSSWLHQRRPTTKDKESISLEVKGMTCNNCVSHVRQALEKLPNIASVDINLATGQTTIHGQNLDSTALIQTIESEGYEVQKPSPGASHADRQK